MVCGNSKNMLDFNLFKKEEKKRVYRKRAVTNKTTKEHTEMDINTNRQHLKIGNYLRLRNV